MMGDLQKLIDSGEYLPLKSVPVFESNFIQVNRRGEPICVHNRPNYVTVGVCASSPSLVLPNVMLLAHPAPVSSEESISVHSSSSSLSCSEDELVLSRFLPLKFVDISIHSVVKKRIKLKLVSGRAYYLELYGPSVRQAILFEQWVKLINQLKSKSSDYSILFKNSDTQERQKAISNTRWKTTSQEQPVRKQEKRHEPEKPQVLKQVTSKRVTISNILAPAEHIGKNRDRVVASSHTTDIRESRMGSQKQNKQQQELRKTIAKKKSREREFFAHSGKRLQTSGILKNDTK